MFSDEIRHDETDLLLFRNIGRWVVIKWRQGLFLPPGLIARGSHLAACIWCIPEIGIKSINVCWLDRSLFGKFRLPEQPMQSDDIPQTTWSFKYETLKELRVTALSDSQVAELRLNDLFPHHTKETSTDKALKDFRGMRHLDRFRHPGYPDDVSAVLGEDVVLPTKPEGIEVAGEQVWVRINRMTDREVFIGTLLNQPVTRTAKKGDEVIVRHISTGTASILFCAPPTRPSAAEPDLKRYSPIIFTVERDEVEICDTSRVEEFFNYFMTSKERARTQFQNLSISISGYDNDPRPLYQIKEVRNFVFKLNEKFSCWLYFMNLSLDGLLAVAMSLLPPPEDGNIKVEIDTEAMYQLLKTQWLPALFDFGAAMGMSDAQLQLTAAQCVDYFVHGRQTPNIDN